MEASDCGVVIRSGTPYVRANSDRQKGNNVEPD